MRFLSSLLIKSGILAVSCFTVAQAAIPTFSDITSSSGISGGGGSWGGHWTDIDGDGDPDLFTTGHLQPLLGGKNQLWRNNGNGTFTDISQAAGFGSSVSIDTHGGAWADFNNDGLPDLVLVSESISLGRPQLLHELWRNNGNGTFSNIAEQAGILGLGHITRGAAVADYDGDSFIDIFMVTIYTHNPFSETQYEDENLLFRNKGDWTFEEVAEAAGVSHIPSRKRTAFWHDYNQDGKPDLYLFPPCRLFSNNGNGTFTDVAGRVGIPLQPTCQGGNSFDADNDGDFDLYVSTGFDEPWVDSFLLNNGQNRFVDSGTAAGLTNGENSRGVTWGDINNDGYDDLYVVNFNNALAPNRMYLNNGDGSFTDVTAATGTEAQVDQGGGADASFVDYNGDGYLDLFVTNGEGNTKGRFALLRNNGVTGAANWIKLQFVGVQSNRDGLMTRVKINDGSDQRVYLHNGPSHWMGQNRIPLHIGLGNRTHLKGATLYWPSGLVQVLPDLPVNQTVTITEGVNP